MPVFVLLLYFAMISVILSPFHHIILHPVICSSTGCVCSAVFRINLVHPNVVMKDDTLYRNQVDVEYPVKKKYV